MINAKKRDYYKGTTLNVMKIFKVLKASHENDESFVTVSELARRCGLHKWTVSRTLDIYMNTIVEVMQPQELEAIGLQAKLVKLKNPELTSQQIVNYLKMRRKLNP